VIFLIHGNQEFLCHEKLTIIEQQYANGEGLGDLGRVRLAGKGLSMATLRAHTDALPFLTRWQIVRVDGLLTWLIDESKRGTPSSAETIRMLSDYLPRLPESSILIFVEPKPLAASHPLYKQIKKLTDAEKGAIFPCSLPKRSRDREQFIRAWLQEKAKTLDMRFRPDALALFSSSMHEDLRAAYQNLEKIRAYLGPGQEIRLEEIRLLVDTALQTSTFQMLKAINNGRKSQAVTLLQSLLLAGQHPLAILATVTRQYRLYVSMKALYEEGLTPDEITAQLKLQKWMVERDLRIARRLSWPRLEATYDRLLATDVAIKRGEMDGDLALQLLIVDLSR